MNSELTRLQGTALCFSGIFLASAAGIGLGMSKVITVLGVAAAVTGGVLGISLVALGVFALLFPFTSDTPSTWDMNGLAREFSLFCRNGFLTELAYTVGIAAIGLASVVKFA